MSKKKEIIRKLKKKKINNRQAKLGNQLRTSFLFSLFLHIVFFPFYFIGWYFKTMKTNIVKFCITNVVLLFGILLYIAVCYITLPDLNKVYYYKPVLSSKFYDRNDELIYEVGNERRTHIDINEIPKMLVYAFIAAEDKTFYTNPGFDLYGLLRVAVVDFVKFFKKQKLQGASTITQQVVKNVLLTNERTITRKVKEIILSYMIAKTMPKDKVMEVYLNHIYLGMQSYGIVSASEEYFGKTVSQLTVPEMALLAAMPKAPSSINPFKNYNRAVARRNYVLQRMMEDGYITPDQYEQYSKTELVVKKRHNFYAPFYAPSFFVQSLLTADETGLNKDNILNDGYKVKLTIDGELQRIAQKALNNSLEEYSKKHGYAGPLYSFDETMLKTNTPAELLRTIDEPEHINRFIMAIVIKVDNNEATIAFKDNGTGKITLTDMLWAKKKISEIEVSGKQINSCKDVVSVGDVVVVDRKTDNSNYYTLEQLPQINGGVLAVNPNTGEILAMVGGYADLAGSFNRTIQAFRQMGSTIKPFIYATALEKGFTPASIFMDADININIGNGIVWTPENDNKRTYGPTTLRRGLEGSKNTVTIRIADAIGIRSIRKAIIKSGLNKKPESNLSVAIGAVESSLVNIAMAYSSFVNGGELKNPYLISYVKNIKQTPVKSMYSNEEQDGNDNISYDNVLGKVYFKDCDLNAKCKIILEDKKVEENKENKIDNKNNENDEDKPANLVDVIEHLDDEQNSEENKDENNENNLKQNDNKNDNKKSSKQCLFSPETSYQIINILQGAVRRGTSVRLNVLGLPIASKTGTSNEGKDLWSIVLSPNLILVSFVGYDIPMQTNNYGSQYALPINKEILSNISQKYKIEDFKTPEGIKFVKINRLTGQPAKDTDEEKYLIFEAFKESDDIVANTNNDNGNDENEVSEQNQSNEENIDITDL